MLVDFSLGLGTRPLSHGNNLDELVCLTIPMLLLGVVFLIVMRNSSQDSDKLDDPAPSEAPCEQPEPDPNNVR